MQCRPFLTFRGQAGGRLGCGHAMAADFGPGLRVVAPQWNDHLWIVYKGVNLPAVPKCTAALQLACAIT